MLKTYIKKLHSSWGEFYQGFILGKQEDQEKKKRECILKQSDLYRCAEPSVLSQVPAFFSTQQPRGKSQLWSGANAVTPADHTLRVSLKRGD